MRIEPIIYNFEYQRKGNTRKSIKGRFKSAEKNKNFWKTWDSAVNTMEKQLDPNKRNYNHCNSLKNSKHLIETLDYEPKIYMNNFIKIEKKGKKYGLNMQDYILEELEKYNSNIGTKIKTVKYKCKKGYMQTKIINVCKKRKIDILKDSDFNTIQNRKKLLEKRFVEVQKEKYEQYYKTHKYT
tara:strand:- start:195 stop:743 length:549 start_codon:yes stop_codon:yes gene_type:complete